MTKDREEFGNSSRCLPERKPTRRDQASSSARPERLTTAASTTDATANATSATTADAQTARTSDAVSVTRRQHNRTLRRWPVMRMSRAANITTGAQPISPDALSARRDTVAQSTADALRGALAAKAKNGTTSASAQPETTLSATATTAATKRFDDHRHGCSPQHPRSCERAGAASRHVGLGRCLQPEGGLPLERAQPKRGADAQPAGSQPAAGGFR